EELEAIVEDEVSQRNVGGSDDGSTTI
ncbi:MAG: hypothetical protein EZS28_014430, partial [Streblomastix strix]